MILKVLADARQVVDHRHAEFAHMGGRADAREHEELRRREGAGGENHGASRLRPRGTAPVDVLDACGTFALEQHTPHVGMCQHSHVLPPHRRAEIGAGRAPPPPPALGDGHVADARLRRRVDIGHAAHAVGDAGLEIGLRQRVPRAAVGDRERAARAVKGVGAVLVVLRALEVGQHACEVPALAAESGPSVIVRRLAAHVGHAVDRAGAAQHLAARHEVAAPVPRRVRLRRVRPVVARVAQCEEEAGCRHRNGEAPIRPACLQHQNAALPVLRQAPGDGTAGGACAHDDVIPRHELVPLIPTCAAHRTRADHDLETAGARNSA